MARRPSKSVLKRCAATGLVAVLATSCSGPKPAPGPPTQQEYPWHTGIVATTFWVGEVFDPKAEDGSQVMSTYDSQWMQSYGGCDGVVGRDGCQTEPRSSANGYFPSSMTPRENPFYLDLPYDDVNNAAAFAERASVIPWAKEPGLARQSNAPGVSFMKNRWVKIRKNGRECYGQIEDAGPGQYQDKEYVFGKDDARPKNKDFNGAGMDVSPALNGCLGFQELNGQDDKVDWQFVDRKDVPDGPWLKLETRTPVQ
ncbi:hypothetical protein [Arthrobacter sp. B3I4]|uniref:hypothetical protein n=1 Tax=Arthrobacter sp. B3I4 TaxID=3042267 RepID=UPI0027820162|nr:hypothetical protein [Arthrobacter sp. B3I4]MDQ0757132.1 hypothetical protein [Arthrobacter sp. B3I4]